MCEKQCLQGRPFVLEMTHTDFRMLNLRCGQYIRNTFFQDFGVKSRGVGCVFLRIIHSCIRYTLLKD